MRYWIRNSRRQYLLFIVILLPAGLFAITHANALAKDLPVLQEEVPPLGKSSVWSPKTEETVMAIQDCIYSGSELQSCMQGIMEQTGASPEAIQFMQYFQGQAYLNDFIEIGTIDIGSIFYPFLGNGNIQIVLLNGEPQIVHTDDFVDINTTCSAEAADLSDRYPNKFTDTVSSRYEYYHDQPGGGQRFVFSYPIVDGCRACPVVGYALVAYDFSDLGYFLSPRVLTISKTRESGLKLFPKPSSELQKFDKLVDNKITFLGFDGKIWVMESDGSQLAPLVSRQDGKIITYALAPEGMNLAYVLDYEDGKNAIRLFNTVTGEDKLLVDQAEFYIWGGIAFNPSGDKIAYTAKFTEVYLIDIINEQKTHIHSLEITGLGPGAPPLAGGLTWSSSGDYLSVDVYAGETVVLQMNEIPTVVTSRDILSNLTRPRISPNDSSIAWLDWAQEKKIFLTNFAGEVKYEFHLPGDSFFGPNTGLSWSPDGSLILLSSDEGLLTLDANSGNTRVIQGNRGAWNPQWSPDGSSIVYSYLPPLESYCRIEDNLRLISADGSKDFDFWVSGKYPAWYPPKRQLKSADTPSIFTNPAPLMDQSYFASIGFKYWKWYEIIEGLIGNDDTRKNADTARQLLLDQGYHAPKLETIRVDDAIPHIEMSSIFYFNGHGKREDDRTLIYFYDGEQYSKLYGGSPAALGDQVPYRFVSELSAPDLKLVVISGCETGKGLESEGNLLWSFSQLPVNVVIGFNQNISQLSSSRWGSNYWNNIAKGSGAIEAAKAAALQEEKAFFPFINRINVQSLAILTDLETDLIIVPAPPHPVKQNGFERNNEE
jgi:hypothetical protein